VNFPSFTHELNFTFFKFPHPYADLVRSPSVLASIFIVIIPLVDIMLDFCQKIWDWFHEKNTKKKKIPDAIIYRLTDRERFIFIMGMILQSTVSFLPLFQFDTETTGVIFYCTRGAYMYMIIHLYMYLYLYICMYIQIYLYLCMNIYIYIYIYMYIYIFININKYIYIYINIFIYIHIYRYRYRYTYIYTYTYKYTFTDIYIHI
jgi:hypothetical protein